jgi:hypothetical protein
MASDFGVLSGEDFLLLWLQIFEPCPERIFHCYGFRFLSPVRRGLFNVMASDFAIPGEDFLLLWLQILESCPERIFYCYGFRFLSLVRRGFFTVMASDF